MASSQDSRKQHTPGYREAAEQALQQLDWVISYLHRIRKPGIARALQANREAISKKYRL